MEAAAGIEPAYRGFADLRLTTWLRRHRNYAGLAQDAERSRKTDRRLTTFRQSRITMGGSAHDEIYVAEATPPRKKAVPRTGFINPREPRCVRPGAVAEARRRRRSRSTTPRRSYDGHGPGRRNLLPTNWLGRSASARGVARRSRTGRPGTPHSSRLADLAPRPSAAAGIYETGSNCMGTRHIA